MPLAPASGVTVHYEEAGQGPLLLLLHGLGGSHAVWAPVVPLFASAHHVVTPDHRGHGASSKPPGPYSIELFAQDLLALLNWLKVEHAALIGLSMGGAAAMRLAADAPERISKLIVVDSWAYPARDFVEQLLRRREMLVKRDLDSYAELTISQLFTPKFTRSNAAAIADFRARIAQLDPDSVISALDACIAHDMRSALSSIQAPTLVIVGRDDKLLPPHHSEYLQRAIPDATLRIIDGCGHMPHWERSEYFCDLVHGFLSEQ